MRVIRFVLIIYLLTGSLTSKTIKDMKIIWSPFQGKKNWTEANKLCTTIGMRLPSSDEINSDIEKGNKKEWEMYGYRFWTIKLLDIDSYEVYNISEDRKEIHLKESEIGIKCRKVEVESDEDSVRIQDEKLLKKYSEYQGTMDWRSANELCESLGMRLPASEELNEIRNKGIAKHWKSDESFYWTSTRHYESIIIVDLRSGKFQASDIRNIASVRCRKF
jgi:hypothetical protein